MCCTLASFTFLNTFQMSNSVGGQPAPKGIHLQGPDCDPLVPSRKVTDVTTVAMLCK